jgi:hypothetical protein
VSRLLTGVSEGGSRQLGFSDHPNYLAAGAVLALPFAYQLVFGSGRRDRLIGAFALPGLLLGVYSSGSRGGAVTACIVLALCVAVHPRTRVYALNAAAGLALLVGFVIAFVPSFGNAILDATRLSAGAPTSGSDSVRAIAGAQGVRDFLEAPFAGIGLQISDQASQVYLQELASGGLVLFIGMTVYMLGGLGSSLALIRHTALGGMLAVAFVATAILNFVEADLTDRFYYVPGAILVAVLEGRRLGAQEQVDGGEVDDADAIAVRA